jgi:hypothetical protein
MVVVKDGEVIEVPADDVLGDKTAEQARTRRRA